MHKKTFKVGHIGCGRWGRNLIRTFDEIGTLQYISDADSTNAINVKSDINNDLEILDFKDLIEKKELDAISIATPAETHFKIASESIKHKKHVYIEKPMTMKTSEAIEIINLAKKHSVKVQVGHLLLYHPAIEKMSELISKNKVGKICYIYSNRLSFGTIRTFENVAWSFMPHDISLILYFANADISSIDFQGRQISSEDNLDSAHLWVNFKNGIKSHIFASWSNPFKEHKLVIIGDKGSLVFEDSALTNKLYFVETQIIFDSNNGYSTHKEEPQIINFSKKLPLEAACENFILSCQENRQPIASAENGKAVVEILEKTSFL